MKLAWRMYGKPSSGRPPVVVLHGLFGNAAQWHHVARALSTQGPVITVDWPNHGRSPHVDRMDYALMADGLRLLLDELAIGRVHLVGHSMGGKAGMVFASLFAPRVASLVVLDIAPVSYPDRYTPLVYAALRVQLDQVHQREDADTQLARYVSSAPVRAMLLQNLARDALGWRWRNHWVGIAASMSSLLTFPSHPIHATAHTPVLFVRGDASDHLTSEHDPWIHALFPHARHAEIAGAGHWLHADQPAALQRVLDDWLQRTTPCRPVVGAALPAMV